MGVSGWFVDVEEGYSRERYWTGTYVSHCEPESNPLVNVICRERKQDGTYIALSKNMSTPPIKKKPPARRISALNWHAPKHIADGVLTA